MPFSFLMMSGVLAGALAGLLAVIPLIVHLLHRQKVTPVAWGAMQFLLESPLRVRRRRKVDNWVLMLLRMLILAVIVFLLCRPTLTLKSDDLVTTLPVDVAVVIDHSMTMGMKQPGGANGGGGAAPGGSPTRFEQGVDLAERISRMLPTSGTMSIVLAEQDPRVVTPAPIKMGLSARSGEGAPLGEWASTLQTMRSLKPGMTKADIPKAVQSARELLTHGYNTRKIIFIISDDQRSNWMPEDITGWKNAVGHSDKTQDHASDIPVFDLSLREPADGRSELANVTIKSLTVTPDFLGKHRPAQILAHVSNTGTKELTNVPLVLEVDGKPVMTQPLPSLAVEASKDVIFDYYFPDPGSHWVRVRADVVDALDADNAATAAVNVRDKLPVLVIDGQLTPGTGTGLASFPQAAFLIAAMQPVDPTVEPSTLIEPTVISVANLAGGAGGVRIEDYPIIVLNDVPRMTKDIVDRIAAHAQAGNGVWIILGPRTEAAFINDVLAKSTLMPITAKSITQAPPPPPGTAQANFVTIDIKEPRNPALSVLTNGGQSERSALTDVTLRQWWTVTPALNTRTILSTTTGDPLMLEMTMGKSGKAILWTTPAGMRTWSNLPLVPSFVPLVNETLFSLAGGKDAGQPRQVAAGTPLIWTGPIPPGGDGPGAVESVQVISPDGNRHSLHPELHGDQYFVQYGIDPAEHASADTAVPGFYEMKFIAPARAGATAPPSVYFSVNMDPEELNPAVLSPEDFAAFKEHLYLTGVISQANGPAAVVELGKAMQATRGGRDLWQWVALLLLILLVLEVGVTFVLVRRQSGKALEEDGLDRVLPKGAVQGGNA